MDQVPNVAQNANLAVILPGGSRQAPALAVPVVRR